MRDPYETLEVRPDATDEEIREAFERLAARYSPEALAGLPLADRVAGERRAKEVANAYRALTGGGNAAPRSVHEAIVEREATTAAMREDEAGEARARWIEGSAARHAEDARRLAAQAAEEREGARTMLLLLALGAAIVAPLLLGYALAR